MKSSCSSKAGAVAILSAGSFLLCGLLGCAPPSSATAPRIKCEVSMAAWCLATFDGFSHLTLRPVDSGWQWTLFSREGSSEAQMRIIESNCHDQADDTIRLIRDVEVKPATGVPYHRIEYVLNTSGCRLVFELPTGPNYIDYRQVMLYGVLVGSERRTQLYKVSN